jgi:hypothetical protein
VHDKLILYAVTEQGMKLQHHRRVEVAQNVAAAAL